MGYAKTAPWRSKAGNVGSKSLDTGHGSNWKQLVILDLGKLKKQLLEYVWGWIPQLIIIYHHSIGNYWWGPCEMSMILGHPQQAGYDWEPWKLGTWRLDHWFQVLVKDLENMHVWLVVQPPLWKIWKSIGMMNFPIYGKIKNVPNHQPACLIGMADYEKIFWKQEMFGHMD